MTDSGQPVIWRIHEGTLEKFATDPGFRSLQGQAPGRDGWTLYVADYSHGLASIDVKTRAVTWLRPPADGTTLGLDGLARHPLGGLVAVQNGIIPPRVVWLNVEEIAATPQVTQVLPIIPLDRTQADGPTLVVIARGGTSLRTVYIANSQWEKYDAAGRRRPGTTLVAPIGLFAPVFGDGVVALEVSPTRGRKF